ncbi:DUF1648 domain-containing protein [Nocardioides gilvus]|uniref:DUF1648 domain-containing protein n=1 Tax=Nocardioides gilvus TaxID=1735589 RepID=UPI000D74CE2F|nr:DUF1648 domain-containing protein [Nocardioides gilvus]
MTPMRWMWLSLVFAMTVLALSWQSMPSGRIPVHFGAGGEADNWGTRNELCGIFGGIVIALWAFMAWLTSGADRLHWSMINMPRKEYWMLPENESLARARLAEDIALTGVWSMALLTAMMPLMVLSVRRGDMGGGLSGAAIAVIVVLTAAGAVGIWQRQKFYRDVPEV